MTSSSTGSASVSEALQFIAEHSHVYLLGRRPDGYPTGWAMTARTRDGAVEFSTYRSSAKVRCLADAAVASVLATSEDDVDHRVLLTEGEVSVLDAAVWFEDDPTTMVRSEVGRSVPSEIIDTVASRHESGKRCVLRVTIERARFSVRLD